MLRPSYHAERENMALINGTSGNDNLVGTSFDDIISAYEGHNVVWAGNGNNKVTAGGGNDTITAGTGHDTIFAGSGNNIIDAGGGNNWITAGSGNDRIVAGAGHDVILAGDGKNVIDAGSGNNTVTTGDGADMVITGSGHDLITTDGGNDMVDSGAGNDVVFLGAGDDVARHDVTANRNSCDIYWGGAGCDTLRLVLSAAQLADPAIQADIARFNATGGGGFLGFFFFRSMNLTLWNFEKIEIVAPVDAGDDVTTVGEDATVIINVLANDRDLGAASNAALRVTGYDAGGLPGTLTLNPNDTFTYVPGAAFQYLAAGESAMRSFSYTIADDQGFSDTASVSVTITGSNDAPVFAPGPATGAITEGGAVTAAGSLAFTDVDASDTHIVSAAPRATGYLGTFTASRTTDSTGGATGQVAWTFSVDPAAIAFLNTGETLTQTYQVSVDDGRGGIAVKDVVITITGTNGPPVATADTATTSENAAIAIAVLANDGDPDGDALTVTAASAPIGRGIATTNGTTVSFDPGTAFDHLAAGASEVVTLGYTISDGQGGTATSTVAVTVTGTNDGPVAVADTAAGTENQILTIDVLGNDSDVDDGAMLTLAAASAPPGKGAVSIVGNRLVFAPGTAFDGLAAGASEIVTIGYTVRDEQGATATATVAITVTGTNDAPVVTGPVTGSAIEDGAAVVLSALANASDADAGTMLTVALGDALPAGVTYDAAAKTFRLDPSAPVFQSLAAGQTTTVAYDYSVSDGMTAVAAQVRWTVTGTNDAPLVAGTVAGSATEDGAAVTLAALANASDSDSGTILSVVPGGALPAGVSFDAATASFTLNPADAAYQSLTAGQTIVVSYDYGVSDGIATTPAQVSWAVTGTNDAPVATPRSAGATEDGPAVSIDARAGASDPDAGTTLAISDIGPLPEGVSYDAATGRFTLDPTAPAFQSLAAGETRVVTVDYALGDGIAPPVATSASWTVTGVNDAPVANPVDGRVAGGSATVNLMLMLDLSTSMTETAGGGQTRLSLAKAALFNLINLYDAKGDVAIRLVTFGDTASDIGGRWLSAAEARAEIASFIPNGATDYDAAIGRARSAFTTDAGKLAGGQNLSYFVSDGQPTYGTLPGNPNQTSNSAALGLNPQEEAAWAGFLTANRINSYAIGIGAGLSPSAVSQYLNPIAYNGAIGANTGAQLVTDVNNLSAVLAATANAPVSGNLLASATPPGSFGPDDPGYVLSITIAGTTYTLNYAANTVSASGGARPFSYNAVTRVLSTTDQSGGALTINLLTGDYSFVVPSTFPLGTQSLVTFTLADLSGATATSTLSLANDGVRDDRIITNSTGTIAIPSAALLANDIDQSGAPIAISAVQQGSGGTVTLGTATVSFAIDPAVGVGSFGYTGTSSTGSDLANVTVDHSQAGSATLTGTAGDDIVIVAAGTAPLVTGGDGNDRLFGGNLIDTYVFDTDDGFDTILDIAGSNIIRVAGTGDLGTFEVRTAPVATNPAGAATDLLVTIGDTVVQVAGGATQKIITEVRFDAGATIYGAALATGYGLAGLGGPSGAGLIYLPTPPSISPTSILNTSGSSGADIMFGGGGVDALNGGAGNDILIGGEGADRLTGGLGADTFVFLSATDSGTTSIQNSLPLYDYILDFAAGQDKVSLMAIDANTALAGDQAFAFVAAPTSAVTANSLTWSVLDANTVTVRGDVNGDTVADFVIRIDSQAASFAPTAADFIL